MIYGRLRFIWAMASILMLLPAPVSAETRLLPTLRISTENVGSHVQTVAVRRFAEELARLTEGRLNVTHQWDARMFRDREVLYALNQGKVEMAVPGAWHIGRFQPNVGIFLLPAFYGREASEIHAIVDGPVGDRISESIETALSVKVIGRWIDLGHAHLFTVNTPIVRHEDIRGMKIRVAGGLGNALRIEALGGDPMIIAWPDLPPKLTQGVVEGVLTSFETVASAGLQDNGIRYAFADRQYFPQYVPMIRRDFWDRMPSDLRAIILRTWEQHVDGARKAAAEAQMAARTTLSKSGVVITEPEPADLRKWRKILMARQAEMARKMQIDPDLLDLALKSFPGE
jgi:TRAP-type C4-dicarboxylate transport system substrate-binding protein